MNWWEHMYMGFYGLILGMVLILLLLIVALTIVWYTQRKISTGRYINICKSLTELLRVRG